MKVQMPAEEKAKNPAKPEEHAEGNARKTNAESRFQEGIERELTVAATY